MGRRRRRWICSGEVRCTVRSHTLKRALSALCLMPATGRCCCCWCCYTYLYPLSQTRLRRSGSCYWSLILNHVACDARVSSEELVDCEAVLLVSFIHAVAFCVVGKVVPTFRINALLLYSRQGHGSLVFPVTHYFHINPLNTELNPICQ